MTRTLGVYTTRKLHTMAPLTVDQRLGIAMFTAPACELTRVHERVIPCDDCRARIARGLMAHPLHPACAAHLGAW